MGSGSSVINECVYENGRIYKTLECKCICSLVYKNYCVENIELLVPCYYCLEDLKDYKYDSKIILNLIGNYSNSNIFELVNLENSNRWLTEKEAIQYAKTRKIPYEEFIPNDEFEKIMPNSQKRDLLKKYNIKY